jgi:putative ABC transport system permease protein
MSALREWLARAAGVFGRRNEDELDDELRFHTEMLEDRLRRGGASAEEAHREARVLVGGAAQVKEAYREQRGLPVVQALVQDIRYGVRTLRRTPGFTLAALLTLALGIGANAAIFSIVHAVLLKPLPYPEPGRIVVIGERGQEGRPGTLGYLTFQDYRDRASTFESMAAVRSWTPTMVVGGEAERLNALRTSWNFFDVLGVRPALGSTFTPAEDRPNQWRVVVLSDRLWRRRFGADPSVIGRTLTMNDETYRVAGVMPASFEPLVSTAFYQPAEMWAPLGYDATLPYACRTCQHLRAIGRVRAGVTADRPHAELSGIRRQLAAAYPTEYDAGDVAVMPLQDFIAGPVRRLLLVLLAAVAFVLLIACGNVANLLLARSTTRAREMAVRSALGAGRPRLVRQLLTESLMLSLAGSLVGVGLAWATLGLVARMAPVTIPRLSQATIDGTVLTFALLLALATGVIFGILPALKTSRHGLQSTLALDSRTGAGGGGRARRILVVADLALALVLLSGAALMLESVGRLMLVDPGFSADRVLTLNFSLVGRAYREDPAVVRFIDRVVGDVAALPGVEAASATGQIPLGGNGDRWGFHIEGRSARNPEEDPSVERYSVTPDYFRVLRIPLKRGRLITDADRTESLPVIVIGETTARLLWPGQDPLGQRVRIGGSDGPWRTVVGIAGDVRHADLAAAPTLQMYLPQTQVTDSFLVLAVRTVSSDPTVIVPQVRDAFRRIDPTVPIYGVAPMSELVYQAVADRRFAMQLLGAFAFVALLLAAIGLYGVVAYTVAQRTRELGVRVALGATPAAVLRLVLGSGIVTVTTGLFIGVAAALVAGQFLGSLLFGVRATDPIALGAAAVTLALVAVAAHLVPARRALRIDPVTALRQE